MPTSNVFQNLFDSSRLERAVEAALIKWFPTYLREIERQNSFDVGYLTTPINYTKRNSYDYVAGEELPKVVVISPGTIGTPVPVGTGKYKATWRLGVGLAHAADTEQGADRLVKVYAAAVKGILLQQQSLDGSVPGLTQIVWTSDSYEAPPIRAQSQFLKAAAIYFAIEIHDVVTKNAGPTTPDLPAYAHGQATTVDIDVVKVPVTSNLP